jgi:hypothetical protein
VLRRGLERQRVQRPPDLLKQFRRLLRNAADLFMCRCDCRMNL